MALADDLHEAALRAYFNLAERKGDTGQIDDAIEMYRVGLALARRVGDTFYDLAMRAGAEVHARVGHGTRHWLWPRP